jgi:hypothetical protein
VPFEVRQQESLTARHGIRLLVACLAAAALAGCGGGSSGWSDAQCRRQADAIAAHGRSILVHYQGSTVYPADVALLLLKNSLKRYDEGGCPDPTLGETLRRQLPPRKQATLLALLPRPTENRFRAALAAAPE